MHTPIEFYVRVPVGLFRRGGKNSPRFDYIRTSPPRKLPEKFDLKVFSQNGNDCIDHKSGGLSLFNKPDFRSGTDWWVIEKGTPLPPGYTVTKDLTGSIFKGHYSIRALQDVDLEKWKRDLGKWAEENAVHINEYNQNTGTKNV